MNPKIISGGSHTDERGTLRFNNDFDVNEIKRIYFIENKNKEIVRAWQGHQIEKRWFTVINGSFLIKLIEIDNWKQPSKKLLSETYRLEPLQFQVLYVPQGYVTSIQALEENSKLMAMSNYQFGEIDDEYRYDQKYFEN